MEIIEKKKARFRIYIHDLDKKGKGSAISISLQASEDVTLKDVKKTILNCLTRKG